MRSVSRTITLRLTDLQRGSLRVALVMAAQDAAARKDQREVTRLDHLVDLLDDAWLAATPKKARWYARREIA